MIVGFLLCVVKVVVKIKDYSFFWVSGYWHPMLATPKSAHSFKPNSTFDRGFKLYCYDRELRQLIMGELEKIEIVVRAKMIYILSHRHGAFWYTNSTLFTNATTHANTLTAIDREYQRTDEKFITDFRSKYSI